MKRGIQLLILVAVLLSFSSCRKNKIDIVYDKKYVKDIKELRKEIAFFLQRNFIPGGSFAIARDGKFIYSEGMGLASKDLDVPVNRKTKFRIAEVSELFTSVIYQMMVQDSILDPDSTVQHYLPDFPQKKYKLTLRDLAYHTSGIREPHFQEEEWKGKPETLQKGIDIFKNDTLITKPGYFQNPSAFNYNLLGAIMEKASGKSFPVLLKEYLTDTLKLTNTVVDNPFITINGRTDYFDYNIVSQVMNAPFCDLRYRAPSEGILSNAEDLVKFANAILYPSVIPDAVKKRLFEPIELKSKFPSRFTNGWINTKTRDGKPIYGMAGGVTGGGASLVVFPDQKLVIAGAVNLTSELDDIPVFKMAEPFFPKTEKPKTDKTKEVPKTDEKAK